MLKECLEVFKYKLNEQGEELILDSYVPADGTYLIVDKNGNIRSKMEIAKDKKTKQIDRTHPDFTDICFYDYQSQLVSMNKPVDSKKIIHSNNYLSFFVKKESILLGKLTDEVIEGYYSVLEDPLKQKYKNSIEASKIYTLYVKEKGEPDREEIKKKKDWIISHIYNLEDVDMEKKNYLKIFFDADKSVYKNEATRYLLPNIYNKNDYNIEIQDVVYGMPDNNLGMNDKKPFLSIKTRKNPASYLLDGEDVLIQKKFFDYLMNLVSSGKYHVYVDTDRKRIDGFENGKAPDSIKTGYYLLLKKGKTEAEIHNQDNIPGYCRKLDPPFEFKNVLQKKQWKHQEYEECFHKYYDRVQVGQLINDVFFYKKLISNYMADPSDIKIKDSILKYSIILSRESIFDWVYKGINKNFNNLLQKVSLELIKTSVLNGYTERALWQFDLRWSFQEYFSEREGNMAEKVSDLKTKVGQKVFADKVIPIETDEEYYYAIGQLAAFLISRNKSKERKQCLINPFLNAKDDKNIKKRLQQLYKKYNYDMSDKDKRTKNLLAMVFSYKPETKVDQEMVTLGFADDNVIYRTEEK